MPNKLQTVRDEFPLRGYLSCPQCKRTLTASASRNRFGNRFFYYHCSNGCKERKKAEIINAEIIPYLATYKANPQIIKLYGAILKQELKQNNSAGRQELENISKAIGKQKQRLKNAKDMMLDGEFSASDYKEMKVEIETELDKLNREKTQFRQGIENYDSKIDDCLDLILNLDKYYVSKNTEIKQKIIGSMFPEKLTFENNEYRTPKTNDAVALFCPTDKDLRGNKNGKKIENSISSREVAPSGIEPES